jgi:energy-coupling factor transport system substrate-specific component
VLSKLIYAVATATGILAFLSPFVWLVQQQASGMAAAGRADSPLILGGLIALCVAALIVESQRSATSLKQLALLAALVAINSALRLADTILPGPGGFTPIFLLIILAGVVFGGQMGFLMGALTMLVSAFITGGVGPWLPYQMLTAGWMGMSAGLLPSRRQGLGAGRPNPDWEIILLCVFAAAWGFVYGAIMNLWEWPFQMGDPAISFQAGVTLQQAIQRYAAFYALTSLWWDFFGAAGNVILMALFGRATLNLLRRFEKKLHVSYHGALRRDAG